MIRRFLNSSISGNYNTKNFLTGANSIKQSIGYSSLWNNEIKLGMRVPTLFCKNLLKIDDVVRLKSVEGYQVFHIGGQEFTINPNFMVGEMTSEIVKKTN
jgi:hypothetical protein